MTATIAATIATILVIWLLAGFVVSLIVGQRLRERREADTWPVDAAEESTPVYDALCFERWEAEL